MPSLIGKLLAKAPAAPARNLSVSEANTWQPWFPGGSTLEVLLRLYGQNGTVWQTVHMKAESVARADWGLYRKARQDGRQRYTTRDTGSDQRTEVIRHAALDLWNAPNPHWTRFGMMELGQTYLEMTGENYLLVTRDDRTGSLPVNLWSVRPDRIEPWPAPLPQYLWGWIYTSPDGQEKIPLRPDEVIQMKYPNPLNPYRGLGPAQAAMTDIETARYAREWNRNFFSEGALPGGILQVSNKLDDDELEKLGDQWREQHRGVGRAHRVALLEAESASWLQPPSGKDMDFVNMIGVTDTSIKTAWGMHGALLGQTEEINRANAESAEEVFGRWKVSPACDRWKEAANFQLLPLYGETGAEVEFDYADPVPPNREQDLAELTGKADAFIKLIDGGVEPHAALEMVGFPDAEIIERATQQPALPPGWVPGAPPAPGAPAPTPAEEALATALLRRLSNGHAKAGSTP